jgi:hypothetical protein
MIRTIPPANREALEQGPAVDFFESPATETGRKFLRGELAEDGR